MKHTRLLLAIGIVSIAAASQAFSFTTEEIGSFTSIYGSNITTVDSTFNVFATSGTGFNFQTGTLDYSYSGATASSAGEAVTGTVTLMGPNTANSMSFNFSGTVTGGVIDAESLTGFANLTGGTGTYASYVSGTGIVSNMSTTLGNNSAGVPSGSTYGAFSASVAQAVPSPAGIIALAIGLSGLVIRRRSK